ncbi:unnamed protein product [Leptosia nina]|uniref:Uncharacterized protein n=1 Tax=Leptosia nina TaxID=320188 RepID=A0AAV1JQM4_9NEOP
MITHGNASGQRSMLFYSINLLSSDKLWPGKVLSDVPWESDYAVMDEYHGDWNTASRKIVNALKPEARVSTEVTLGSVWSAVLGAVFGAGVVMIIAALLFVFRRPKKQEHQLAPIEVGQNVSID